MPKPGDLQQSLLDKLHDADPDLEADWDDARGVARRVRGNLPASTDSLDAAPGALRRFLADFGALFGPDDPDRTLRDGRSREDDLGWRHVTLQQVVPGGDGLPRGTEFVPVNGAAIAAHFAPDGTLTEIQSSCWPAATRPVVTTSAATRAGRRTTRSDSVPASSIVLLTPAGLRDRLIAAGRHRPGYDRIQAQVEKTDDGKEFPLTSRPVLILQPWKGGFRLAWQVYGYAPVDVEDAAGNPTGEESVDFGELIVDAETGEILVFAPTKKYAETATTGTGTGVTPLGSPATRTLDIVRVDLTSTYRLRDTTEARDVITYDAAGDAAFGTRAEIVAAIAGGTLPVSADTDGDHAWTTTASNTTDAQRTASQQPEVDAHFICADLYEWYDALAGGRAGWDDDKYSDPPVPHQPVRVITHVFDESATTSRSVNAFMDRSMSGGVWYSWLAFFDGNPTATCTTANDRAFDYLAGSKFIVGHEFQHAITDFSFEDAGGNPGLTYSGWFSAVHEGVSDVFGTLYAEEWLPGPEISTANLVFRNLAYPRDPNSWVNRTGGIPCGLSNHGKDHWDDRSLDGGFRYDRGTILAHASYLIGAGGVHQRTTRTPVFIPVGSLGHETVNGRDVLKAARIWYRALTTYFSTHGTLTGIPTNDETTFRTLRDGCVSAAIDLYGSGSREHRLTVLAFYAVGLHPAGTTYGPDVTCLPWGAAWWRSRSFIGLPSPDWASLDLFVNNGGASEWNAQINVIDVAGNPTEFENTVYCRVRNVGDQSATNVVVWFEYAKAGTGSTTWLPVTDKNGLQQTLAIGTLAAGVQTFPESAQNSPPASASVKWYIPPLAAGEVVDHFCLRATVTAANDVNTHNNVVQSNIAYVPYTGGTSFTHWFLAGNPRKDPAELKLILESRELPKDWRTRFTEKLPRRLKPGQEIQVGVTVEMGPDADRRLDPPYDGQVMGDLYGPLTGAFAGALTDVRVVGGQLTGVLSGHVGRLTGVGGQFEGTLDRSTGRIEGVVRGASCCADGDRIGFEGCLRPFRRVNVSQILGGDPIGGVTLQVQVPPLHAGCRFEVPPTATLVDAIAKEPA